MAFEYIGAEIALISKKEIILEQQQILITNRLILSI